MLNVTTLEILDDNYAYILQSGDNIALIDPADSTAFIAHCGGQNLTPNVIFNTHHHADHTDGNKALKEKYSIEILGPEKERAKILGLDKGLKDGDEFMFGDEKVEIIETAGHTMGHICYYFPQSKILFSADALFVMGCGRLFEGDAALAFNDLQKIKALPDETKIYCGHEYSLANAKFSISQAPDNKDIQNRLAEIENLRNQNKPTVPTTLAQEKKSNLFLIADTAEEFKKYRDAKDNF